MPSPAKVEKESQGLAGRFTTKQDLGRAIVHWGTHSFTPTSHSSSTITSTRLTERWVRHSEQSTCGKSTWNVRKQHQRRHRLQLQERRTSMGSSLRLWRSFVTKRENPCRSRESRANPFLSARSASGFYFRSKSQCQHPKSSSLTTKELCPNLTNRPLTTAEVIRKGTQATQRASTAGYSRSKEAIARVVKLVPKRPDGCNAKFYQTTCWVRS